MSLYDKDGVLHYILYTEEKIIMKSLDGDYDSGEQIIALIGFMLTLEKIGLISSC